MTGRWGRPVAARVLAGCAAVLAASCAATVPPGLPVVADPPAAPVVPAVRVLQMNLCNSGIAGCYTGRSVAEAAAVVRAEAPDVVTLNEICEDDVAVVERALSESNGAAGGDATASAFRAAGDRRTGGPFRCRNGRAFGVGVVARSAGPAGGTGDSSYATEGGLYPMQDARDPEERAWVCLRPIDPGPTDPGPPGAAGRVAACTTHLIDTDPALARAQCAHLLRTVVPAVRARSGSGVVFGGDLNLRAGGSPDVRACVPDDDLRADDGTVQHVVATPGFAVAARRTITLRATDHPGLLVTLTRTAGAAPR